MRARSKRSSSSRSALTPPPEAARPSQATFSGGSPLPPVLVVEDEPAIVDLLVMLLKPLRTTLLCAHTGEEALHHLQTRRPALVTLDLVLPDMTGLRWKATNAPALVRYWSYWQKHEPTFGKA